MKLPSVTAENYFAPEIQMAYMGASQFKSFRKCEAAALAEARGEHERPATTALLVGSYVDAHFSGEMDRFRSEHPELFKRDGSLKSDYIKADEIIRCLEKDRLFSLLMSGRKQVIRTGFIAGVPFKIKIDSLLGPDEVSAIVSEFPETARVFGFGGGTIVDLKIMRDMEPVWSDEEHRYVNFVEAWGYDIQGAIYQAVESHMLPFVLAVGTKENVPDFSALSVSDGDLQAKLAEIEDAAPRYQAIKEGKIPPRSCGRCDWCRAHKRLTSIIDYKEVGPVA